MSKAPIGAPTAQTAITDEISFVYPTTFPVILDKKQKQPLRWVSVSHKRIYKGQTLLCRHGCKLRNKNHELFYCRV